MNTSLKCSFNVTSKHVKPNITQNPNQCSPAHWLLPSPSKPLLENLHVDLLSIVHVFVGNSSNPCPVMVFKEDDAKNIIINTDVLGNVDLSVSSLEVQ